MDKDKLLGRIHKINQLIHICKDEEQGFRQAAVEAQDEKIKALFLSTSRQRAEFSLTLQEEVRKLGAEPAETGSFTGTFHRGWMYVRDHVEIMHRDLAILQECKRGEESALKVYEDIFEFKLLPGMENILEPQYVRLVETRNKLMASIPTKEKGIDDSILHLHQ